VSASRMQERDPRCAMDRGAESWLSTSLWHGRNIQWSGATDSGQQAWSESSAAEVGSGHATCASRRSCGPSRGALVVGLELRTDADNGAHKTAWGSPPGRRDM
jgi:hypothetical protein